MRTKILSLGFEFELALEFVLSHHNQSLELHALTTKPVANFMKLLPQYLVRIRALLKFMVVNRLNYARELVVCANVCV